MLHATIYIRINLVRYRATKLHLWYLGGFQKTQIIKFKSKIAVFNAKKTVLTKWKTIQFNIINILDKYKLVSL